jgi:predicted nuclease of predicted toxin-antitoxin system
MKFLLDQSSDARLVHYLKGLGHDATRIGADHPPGLTDRQVLLLAQTEGRILITDDRDFGELVFRLRQPHTGIIFLRLGDFTDFATKIERIAHILTHYPDQLDRFLVVTRTSVRVR